MGSARGAFGQAMHREGGHLLVWCPAMGAVCWGSTSRKKFETPQVWPCLYSHEQPDALWRAQGRPSKMETLVNVQVISLAAANVDSTSLCAARSVSSQFPDDASMHQRSLQGAKRVFRGMNMMAHWQDKDTCIQVSNCAITSSPFPILAPFAGCLKSVRQTSKP